MAKKGNVLAEWIRVKDVDDDVVDQRKRGIAIRDDGVILEMHSSHFKADEYSKAYWHRYGWKRAGRLKQEVRANPERMAQAIDRIGERAKAQGYKRTK